MNTFLVNLFWRIPKEIWTEVDWDQLVRREDITAESLTTIKVECFHFTEYKGGHWLKSVIGIIYSNETVFLQTQMQLNILFKS